MLNYYTLAKEDRCLCPTLTGGRWRRVITSVALVLRVRLSSNEPKVLLMTLILVDARAARAQR